MAFLNFNFKPKNDLEDDGTAGVSAPQADDAEPEKECPSCHRHIPVSQLQSANNVCACGYHFRMNVRQRLRFIADRGTFNEMFSEIGTSDPISFPGYDEKIAKVKDQSKEDEGVVCGTARVGGRDCCLFIMEPNFMMGSMGTAVGERITRLFEYATEARLPVVGYTVSGGARMQEGLISLMQMAKTSAAVKRHSDAGLFYLAILTNPTTGGVTASFAMEGDIIIAEPSATVGFAGARVIEQTTRKVLPKGFQTSEFVMQHGFIDAIVPRKNQKNVVVRLLMLNEG